MTSIPASQLVNVIPGVLGAGGNPLSLNAIFLTADTAVPIGTVMPFSTLADVQDFFGATSVEAELAAIYFAGYDGATSLPSTLYFVQYNTANVGAYLRGGSLADMTLAELQALSGTIIVTIDGTAQTSTAINLSTATSFSNAAGIIQTALQGGTPGGSMTVTYDSQRAAFVIHSSTTGSPGSTIGFATGTLAAGIKLQAAQGAVTSQGANTAVPATLMDSIVAVTQNWATFMTTTEPIDATKLLFAAWVQTTNSRYTYVAWDSNVLAEQANQPTTFGAIVNANDDVGVVPVFETDGHIAAFICGVAASIDFTQANGRITFAFKHQPGIAANVTDATIADNLIGNGYNFYGSYATANDLFTFLQPGQISGAWDWIDAYINQIQLNAAFQLAFMELLSNINSVPYNENGYNLLRAAAQDPIDAALNFGSIQAGIALSSSQAAQVNTAAGYRISDTLSQRGWYLQVSPADALTRAARESPPMTFWYTDGGSVQRIELSSIDVQ
jgi:hypothetical protein